MEFFPLDAGSFEIHTVSVGWDYAPAALSLVDADALWRLSPCGKGIEPSGAPPWLGTR
jgi:hypothetical protein